MKVADLLTDESKWCQGHNAVDADGFATSARGKKAVRWCLYGAVDRCYSRATAKDAEDKLLDTIERHDDTALMSIWNDAPDRTFAEVRAVILEAGV